MLRIFQQYYPLRNLFFIIGECLAIVFSVLAACWVVFGIEAFSLYKWLGLKTLMITVICQACLYYNDLYNLQVADTFPELGIRLFQALGAAAIFLALLYFIFPDLIIAKGVFVVSICIVIAFIISWRFLYMIILDRGIFNQKIIIVGDSELAQAIQDEIKEKKDCGYSVGAIVRQSPGDDENMDLPKDTLIISSYENLCEEAKALEINKIVVAFKERRGIFPTKELLNCRTEGLDIIDGNSFYEMLTGKIVVRQINPAWLIFSEGFKRPPSSRFFKRMEDIFFSLVLLVLLFPFFLVTSILITLDSRGPLFFRQERIGAKRRPYSMFKFRSMVADAEKESGPVWAEDNDKRVTRVGRFIRRWRMDEIPQLWNVLKGEMSFVGPRPEREYFIRQLEEKIPYYGERFKAKPGITGWAQVSYGYGGSVEDAIEKLNYDLFYIKNMSFLMDLVIVFRTVKIVIFGTGAR